MTTLASLPTLTEPTALQVIQAAGRAPSPDNNQPWAFRALTDAIEVFHRRERALPSDVRDLFSWISLGAAIENAALVASSAGWRSDVVYHERPFVTSADGEHIATIHLRERGEVDPLHEFIEQRETNRLLYEGTPLSTEQTAQLSQAVTASANRVGWISGQCERNQLAKLVAAADRIRFEDQCSHEEFHRALRYGDEEARQAGDGLDLRTLEIPRPVWPVLRWLRPWNRMQFLNRLGMSRLFADYSVKQVRHCGAVGLLVTDSSGDAGYLEAGRSLQRLWLTATQMGLAFQPLGSIPLFLTLHRTTQRRATPQCRARQEAAPGNAHIDDTALSPADRPLPDQRGSETSTTDANEILCKPRDRRRLETIEDGTHALYPDVAAAAPVMLFRVGRAATPSARSYRYPLSRILLLPPNHT